MEILYSDFVQCCPAAQTPDTEIFESISAQIQKWNNWARELVTPEIYDKLGNIDASPITQEYDDLYSLRNDLIGVVCSMAFWEAIPQLDLVITSTGFGVVSNSNVAPASADRVDALRKQIRRQALGYLEQVLDISRLFDIPAKSKLCGSFFRTLFWRPTHLRAFGIITPTYDDLWTKMPQIDLGHTYLSGIISPEQLRALIKAEASASTTYAQNSLIRMCRQLCAYTSSEYAAEFNKLRLDILGYMDESLDDFPEYRDSETYKAIHFQRYENKADDSCFFFG